MSSGTEVPLSRLSTDLRSLLDTARDFGRDHGIEIYLVGGAVRDLLLAREIRDLDLVWEGAPDAGRIARSFGEGFDAEVTYHPEFLTASLTVAGGTRLDLGRARAESYPKPAALPVVQPSSLREDLLRRDFSINALAVNLDGRPALIDVCSGEADLEQRRLRTLHELSFRDDPTRLLRGCELAARRGLEFEPGTLRQVEASIERGDPAGLSGTRVRHELIRLLRAPAYAAGGAGCLHTLGIDRALHQEFRIEAAGLARLRRLSGRLSERGLGFLGEVSFWLPALSALFWHRPEPERRRLAAWLALGRDQRPWLESLPERLGPLVGGDGAVEWPAEAMAHRFNSLSGAEAGMVELLAEPDRGPRLRAARRLAAVELGLGGGELLQAGVLSGPLVGQALTATLEARRRGEIDAAGELAYALEWIRRKESGNEPS